MKAVVWHGVGKIALEEVPDLGIRDPADAVVRIITSAICGPTCTSCAAPWAGCATARSSVTRRSA